MAGSIAPKFVSDILTVEQCDEVWDALQLYRPQWIRLGDTCVFGVHTPQEVIKSTLATAGYYDNHRPYYFGPAYYYAKRFGNTAYIEVARKYNKMLGREFGWLYDLIKPHISTLLGIRCEYGNNTSMPGFHIYGPGFDGGVVYNQFHFHQDYLTGAAALDGISLKYLHSVIVPIKLPKQGTALEWIDNNNTRQTFSYEVGKMYHWPSTTPHRIKPFTLHEDEWRVTMQVHVAIGYDNTGLLFW